MIIIAISKEKKRTLDEGIEVETELSRQKNNEIDRSALQNSSESSKSSESSQINNEEEENEI